MKRTFAIGDIHGGLKALKQLLERINLQYTDELIFLGDYVDGWSDSAQVIEFLIELKRMYACTFIRGNHDIWCEEWLSGEKPNPVWLYAGGQETLDSYEGYSSEEKEIHLDFFQQMKPYHISKENDLFIHAGFTSVDGVNKEDNKLSYCFDRSLWQTAMLLDGRYDVTSNDYPSRFKHYKEIYIGHTPTTKFNSELPMHKCNVWNVDTGAAFKGKLSAVELQSKEIFQSDTVQSLYPYELGRNMR
jgi:serine/threonine protein phosphatase 1